MGTLWERYVVVLLSRHLILQVAVGATFAVRALGVSSVEEFRDVMRGFGDPLAQSLQDALVPLKARIQVLT